MPSDSNSGLEKASALDRWLRLFGDVRAGEGLTVVLLAVNLFSLLTAYLIIKTVREALILSEGGAEVKSYTAGGQAVLLFLLVPIYGYLASKVNRIKLLNATSLFFISNLGAFYLLSHLDVPLGVAFFLWVGVFNLFIIAQFWSFANDIYTEDQGKRLFAIIAFGGSLGAILGPKIASSLFEPFGPYLLMLLTAALLSFCMIFPNIVHRREGAGARAPQQDKDSEQPLTKGGAFRLVIGKRYLLLIAFLMVITNIVNTTGEFILGKTLTEEAHRTIDMAQAGAAQVETAEPVLEKVNDKKIRDFIGRFYGDFFFTVNITSALAQLFLVSRIMKYCGISASLFFLPIVALTGYSAISLFPTLAFIRAAKVVENSTDYSLQNTVRQALFLPTSREEKYKAKAVTDTFFVRIGDLLSTALVVLSVQFSLNVRALSLVNVMLVVLWLLGVVAIGRRYRGLATKAESIPPRAGGSGPSKIG